VRNDPPKVPPPSKGGIQYRLYFFNSMFHIERSHEFEAKDDAQAIRIAEGWREGRTMELWQGDRRLKQWS